MKKGVDIKRLPEAELEIMLLLWQAECGVPRNYFDTQLQARKNWADSTILSLLSRLAQKGFIKVEKDGNRNIYSALVTKDAYLAVENNSFLARLHKNSLTDFVASMAHGGFLSCEDIDDLEAYLAALKQQRRE